MEYDREFLTGTVGVLILSLLNERDMYGYELLREADQRSESTFHLKEGTLYPALVRLEHNGWIKGAWQKTENNRDAKYYAITVTGRRALEREAARWRRLVSLVDKLLLTEPS